MIQKEKRESSILNHGIEVKRRDFLKRVGAGAAGVMIGAETQNLAWGQAARGVNAGPADLLMRAPSDVVANKPFSVDVVPLTGDGDLYGDYPGSPSLTVEGQSIPAVSVKLADAALVPGANALDQFKKGTARITLPAPGYYRLVLTDGQSTTGFPVKCHATEPEEKLYWGEIHCHSEWDKDAIHAQGSLDPVHCFSWGRQVGCLDFGSVICHHWSFAQDKWQEMAKIINSSDDSGRFVALLGYEFGQGDRPGARLNHNNAYFLGNEAPWPPNMKSIREFWPWLEQNSRVPVLCIPHHPALEGIRTEWDTHNPKFQQIVELYSTHGNSECKGNMHPGVCNWKPGYVHNALERGYILGFICGSDNHGGRMGTNSKMGCRLGGKRTGLAALRAPELTRKGMWDSIVNRNTYGTSGCQHIILEVDMDGHRMGEKFIGGRKDRKLSVEVAGTTDIARIEVVKNTHVVHSVQGKSWHETMEFTDKAERSTDWYYVRVVQKDDNLAWSSPIWVTQ